MGRDVFRIGAEHPDLAGDGAVVRVEQEVRRVLARRHPVWQRGGWRPRNAQIEEDLAFHGMVLLLDMDVVCRGKIWREEARQ